MATKKKTFEEGLQRLEEIVNLIERGESGLEEAVKLYKEGLDISMECMGKLKDARQQVSILRKKAEDTFEKQPFSLTEE